MSTQRKPDYATRSAWVQAVSPAPKRLLQELIARDGLATGLDVGCGPGSPLTALRGPHFRSTGIDSYAGALEAAREREVHDEYLQADFLGHRFEQQFDVVVLSHVIEHFPRDLGMEVLRKAEQLARRIVYVETPHGFLEQVPEDDNPGQRHLSGWFPHDFESRAYTVFGSGLRGLTGPRGKSLLFPDAITRFIVRATQWYCFRRPAHAATLAAIRYSDATGNYRNL